VPDNWVSPMAIIGRIICTGKKILPVYRKL
jgi:hypothetical protein